MKNDFRTRRKSLYLWCIAWILFLMGSANPTSASPLQNRTVTGTVTSGTDGEALIGVSVQIQERPAVGTITDLDGKYSIQARSNETLIFSYIGYQTQKIKANKTIVNVQLKEDSEILDEVVVVGYGTMKKSDLTGAVTSVSEDEIKQSVVTLLDQALQSRAAGVSVTQNSGAPGGGISVSIRGINSLNGNEPLYVVDGVAISGNNNTNSSVLSAINPSDIVSIEILKDASATAIYGSLKRCRPHHYPTRQSGEDADFIRRILWSATASQTVGCAEPTRICRILQYAHGNHRIWGTYRIPGSFLAGRGDKLAG